MNIDCTCGFYKHDFSALPFFWKQRPADKYGRWMFVFNWFGFEFVINGWRK